MSTPRVELVAPDISGYYGNPGVPYVTTLDSGKPGPDAMGASDALTQPAASCPSARAYCQPASQPASQGANPKLLGHQPAATQLHCNVLHGGRGGAPAARPLAPPALLVAPAAWDPASAACLPDTP